MKDGQFLDSEIKKSISNAKPSSYNLMNIAGHSFSGTDHEQRFKSYNWKYGCLEYS
jgi:hypothetical protein